MRDAMQAYLEVRTANATGYTVEQVRTLNRLEAETQRAYESECRRAARLEPVFPQVEEFRVEHDVRIGLPRVDYFDTEHDWMFTGIAVLADGRLDRTL